MGMILGITGELSIPVKGFVAQPLVSVPDELPEGFLLHLDIYLHRFEVTYVEQSDRLIQKDSLSANRSGVSRLYREWVDTIAEEFVRTTRFDPLHQAASEQELYDRLPEVLDQLQGNPTIGFEMKGGAKTYHVTLTQDLFARKVESIYREVGHLVDHLLKQHGEGEPSVVLQMSHRVARLPGIKEILGAEGDRVVIELERGIGALRLLRFWDASPAQQSGRGVPFLTSRPLPSMGQTGVKRSLADVAPTHLLYRNVAYLISEEPLYVGPKGAGSGSGLVIEEEKAGSPKHCSLQLRDRQVVLINYSSEGTFVDEILIKESAVLKLGQSIRVTSSEEPLQLIATRDIHET
jgi:hypothetical protein